VVDCPDKHEAATPEDGYYRVCGVNELPPEKIGKKVLRFFDTLGLTLRLPWNEGEIIGGGCIYDGGQATLFANIARTGSLASEGEPFHNVEFSIISLPE